MKQIARSLLAILVCAAVTAQAQDNSRHTELSLSGAFGSVKQKTTMAGQSHESEAQSYGTLSFRPGWNVGMGLSLEPELMWSAFEGNPPCYFFVGNVSLSAFQGSTTPFLSIGYGLGNSMPLAGFMASRMSDKLDITLLTLGGGLKVPVGESALIRIEFRHQAYKLSRDYPSYSFTPYPVVTTSTMELTTTMDNLFVGLTLLL